MGLRMLEMILQKFYAASITIGSDGSVLISSTRERMLVWAVVFCLTAATCLISYLLWRNKPAKRIAIGLFIVTLMIPVLIIPSIRNEYIHVTPMMITVDTGTWHTQSKTILHLTEIKNIIEQDENSFFPGNLRDDPQIKWHFTWEDGNSHSMELNDFFNAHRMVVAYYYKDRGFWPERLEDQNRPQTVF